MVERQISSQFVHYVKEQADILERLVKKKGRLLSPKEVHDLRVVTRRLRASLVLLNDQPDQTHLLKLYRTLSKLGKALGAQRELDVALQDARHYSLDTSDLRKSHRKLRDKVRDKLNSKRRKRIFRQLRKINTDLQSRKTIRLEKAFDRHLKEANRWKHQELKDLKQLHELRIAIKKFRYALEALGRPVQPLRKLQNLLGRVHDLEILQRSVGRNAAVSLDQASTLTKAKRLVRPALQFTESQIQSIIH